MADVPVYLHYTQAQLDDAYDQRVWAPNSAEVIAGYGKGSEAARARLTHRSGIVYGPTADEKW